MKAILIAIFLTTVFLQTPQAFGANPLVEEQVLEISSQTGSLLSDPIIGLSVGSVLYLPLLDLARVLGVKVEQPEENKLVVSLSPEETKTLDLTACGRDSKDIVCKNFITARGVSYASTEFLKDELHWPLDADLKNLRITVNTGSRKEEALMKKKEAKPLFIQRSLIDYPSFRAEGAYTSPKDSHALSLYAAHPLFEQDSQLFVFDQDGHTRTRWTLSQQMVEEDRPPLAPKNYEAVSTQTLDMKYLFSPTQILGAKISNLRYDDNIFDTHNIYQKGPPRWKVELYLNGVYLGETTVDLNGDFSFLNVPLFYGENRIVYRFTSPLGKVIEMPETYNISADFEGANKLRYQIAYGQIENTSDYMGGFQASYGLSSYVSAQAGLAQFPLPDKVHTYSILGVSYLQPSYSLSTAKLSSTDTDGSALGFSPKANVGGVLLSAEYTDFKNFRSLLINKSGTTDQVALAKASALSSFKWRVPFTAQLQYEEDKFASSPTVQEAQLRMYSMFERKSLLTEVTQAWPTTMHPDLYVEVGDYHTSFRGKYGVLIHDDKYGKSHVGIDAMLPKEFFFSLDLEAPVRISDSAYIVGLSRLFWDLQTELNYTTSNSGNSVTLIVSTNMKTSSQGAQLTQDESYLQGHIEIFAFVDENANGKFDPEEKPFSRLRVLHVQRQKDYETDANGHVTIPGLNPYQRVSLEVVKESITNIFLTPQEFKNDFILIPAQNLRVEVPITPSFDVRGRLDNSFYKKLVPMELLNSNGTVVEQATSTAQGNYRFNDVPAGTYSVRISPDFLSQNKLSAEPLSQEISVTGKPGVKTLPLTSLKTSKKMRH
jgi:hypothetical protein